MAISAAGDLFDRCLTARRSEDWRELVDCFGKRVRKALRRSLRRLGLPAPDHEVDELVQELFCRLWLTASRNHLEARQRSERDVWAYLSQAARNLVVDLVRARSGAKHRILGGRRGWRLVGRGRWLELESGEPSPERSLLEKERRRGFLEDCVRVCRGASAGLQLEALRLAFFEGWTSPEIARGLGGLEPADVDHVVFRLRRRLATRRGVILPRRNAAGS